MSAPTVYVVADQRRVESHDGRPWVDEDIDVDYGYFPTYESAQAFADVLDAGPFEERQTRRAAHEKRVRVWGRKQARAAKLGVASTDDCPALNDKGAPVHLVVEISPWPSTNPTATVTVTVTVTGRTDP